MKKITSLELDPLLIEFAPDTANSLSNESWPWAKCKSISQATAAAKTLGISTCPLFVILDSAGMVLRVGGRAMILNAP